MCAYLCEHLSLSEQQWQNNFVIIITTLCYCKTTKTEIISIETNIFFEYYIHLCD